MHIYFSGPNFDLTDSRIFHTPVLTEVENSSQQPLSISVLRINSSPRPAYAETHPRRNSSLKFQRTPDIRHSIAIVKDDDVRTVLQNQFRTTQSTLPKLTLQSYSFEQVQESLKYSTTESYFSLRKNKTNEHSQETLMPVDQPIRSSAASFTSTPIIDSSLREIETNSKNGSTISTSVTNIPNEYILPSTGSNTTTQSTTGKQNPRSKARIRARLRNRRKYGKRLNDSITSRRKAFRKKAESPIILVNLKHSNESKRGEIVHESVSSAINEDSHSTIHSEKFYKSNPNETNSNTSISKAVGGDNHMLNSSYVNLILPENISSNNELTSAHTELTTSIPTVNHIGVLSNNLREFRKTYSGPKVIFNLLQNSDQNEKRESSNDIADASHVFSRNYNFKDNSTIPSLELTSVNLLSQHKFSNVERGNENTDQITTKSHSFTSQFLDENPTDITKPTSTDTTVLQFEKNSNQLLGYADDPFHVSKTLNGSSRSVEVVHDHQSSPQTPTESGLIQYLQNNFPALQGRLNTTAQIYLTSTTLAVDSTTIPSSKNYGLSPEDTSKVIHQDIDIPVAGFRGLDAHFDILQPSRSIESQPTLSIPISSSDSKVLKPNSSTLKNTNPKIFSSVFENSFNESKIIQHEGISYIRKNFLIMPLYNETLTRFQYPIGGILTSDIEIPSLSNSIDGKSIDTDVDIPEPFTETSLLNQRLPIYQEIAGTLHIDSSIDDTLDADEPIAPTTEDDNDEEYLPLANSSLVNLVDPLIAVNKPNTVNSGKPKLDPLRGSTPSTARPVVSKSSATAREALSDGLLAKRHYSFVLKQKGKE